MINILIPASKRADFFKGSEYPRILFEVNGRTMLQQAIEEYSGLEGARFVFTFLREECRKFHFDKVARLITGGNCEVVRVNGQTGGGLCSCLMCVEHIGNGDELIISNFDQVIDVDYGAVLGRFRERGADAGVISFENFHPQWSYIRTEGELVVESAAKRPISKNAIAGFCYFRHGADFVEAAKRVLFKGRADGLPYYVSDSLNELVLDGKRVLHYPIETSAYHKFRILEDVKNYEEGRA